MEDLHPLLTALQQYQRNLSLQGIKLQNILSYAKRQTDSLSQHPTEIDWLPNEEIAPDTKEAIITLAAYLADKVETTSK